MLFKYQYDTPPKQVSVFKQLFETFKRPRVHRERRISSEEYQKVKVNMIKRGRAQSAVPRYNTSGEPEHDMGYCHTRSHDSRLPLSDYERVNVKAFEVHSAISVSLIPVLTKSPP